MRIPKFLVATGIVLGSAAATTFAFAAWTSSGAGSGSVAAKSSVPVTVTSVSVPDALYPGAQGKTLSVKVKNTNDYAVTVSGINNADTPAVTVDSQHSTCNVSSVTFTNQTAGVVLNKDEEQQIDAAGVNMGVDANDNCQGATFTIAVKAIAASSAGH